jgi:antitoxin YefM
MRPVSISDLRSNMKKYFSSVVKSLDILIVPTKEKDNGGVVIMSVSHYNSLFETSYLLSTAANRQRLAESLGQLEQGQTKAYTLDNLPVGL